MEEKELNLVEILKDAPKGTKLWSPLCGECEFGGILSPNNIFKIRVKYEEEEGNTTQYLCFSSQGKYCNNSKAECLLFPSKTNKDWSTFKVPWKHKHFEPFQKVLVTNNDNLWRADYYSHWSDVNELHYCISGRAYFDNEIIPYEGNEDKLGKPIK